MRIGNTPVTCDWVAEQGLHCTRKTGETVLTTTAKISLPGPER